MSKAETRAGSKRSGFSAKMDIIPALIGLLVVGLFIPTVPAFSEDSRDWITGLPREPIHVETWPAEKKVAVCFVLYVEVWGFWARSQLPTRYGVAGSGRCR